MMLLVNDSVGDDTMKRKETLPFSFSMTWLLSLPMQRSPAIPEKNDKSVLCLCADRGGFHARQEWVSSRRNNRCTDGGSLDEDSLE